ncbi:MAG: ParB/RepB/Spo0J family partition protein [Kiritimatiellae bacterium]|nr:ParB/RepB/Spo0J family partition protein [Kiritimatiellia bacterium]
MTAQAKGGLGRGLGALIAPRRSESGTSDASPAAAASAALSAAAHAHAAQTPGGPPSMVEVGRIRANRRQPRHRFEAEPMDELVSSIRAHGILQPLIVRRSDEGYELIAGERRLRAARAIGLTSVPARLVDCDDATALEWALVENLQRENLNPIEEADGYRELQEQFKLTQEQVAERVGKPRATVANALRLLSLPADVREMVEQGRLAAGHAKVLLSAPTGLMSALARQCAIEGWSVRDLEREAAKRSRGVAPRKPRVARDDVPPEHARDLQELLQQKLGTAVRVTSSQTLPNGKKRRGRIEIDYLTADDLDRLMLILGLSNEF